MENNWQVNDQPPEKTEDAKIPEEYLAWNFLEGPLFHNCLSKPLNAISNLQLVKRAP